MNLHGLKTLRLIFLCSIAVSCVQLLLYRAIVLNAKYSHDARYLWKLEQHEYFNKNVDTSIINESAVVKTSNLLQEEKQTTRANIRFEGNPQTCNLHKSMSKYHPFPVMTSGMSDWTFSRRLVCPALSIKNRINTERMKLVIRCYKDVVSADLEPTNSTNDIQRFRPIDSKCLKAFIQSCCTDSFPVPNVVHYVWFNKKKLSFFEFVSLVSILRFVRPCAIIIHGDTLPAGDYWNFIVNLYPNIIHVVRIVKTILFDKIVVYPEHNKNIWSLKSLYSFGGIYMDTDILLVKPIDSLRRYPSALFRQSKNDSVSSAFILAERNATFIGEWLDWYKVYYVNDSYSYNSRKYPSILANRMPENIHIEYGTVLRVPDTEIPEVLFSTNINWSKLFGMHLNVRSYIKYSQYIEENNIRYFNTTVGAVCRHILFGNKELCT